MAEKEISLYEGDESTLPLLPIIDGQLIICKDTGNIYKDNDGKRNPLGGHVEVIDSLPLAPIEYKLYYYNTKGDRGFCYYEGGKWQLIITYESLKLFLNNFKKSLHTHNNQEILDATEIAYTNEEQHKVKTAYEHSESVHAPADAEKNIFNKIKVNGVEVTPNADREAELRIPKSGGDVEVQDNYTMKVKRVDASSVDGVLSENNIPDIDASKLKGTIPIEKIPKAALERLVPVEDNTARFALTTKYVQNGDTVKVEDTGLMYYVKDDTKLDSEDGYEPYTASEAASVEWRNVKNHPSIVKGATDTEDGVSGFVPTPTTHDVNRFFKGNGAFSDIDASDIKNLSEVAKSGSYNDLKDTPKPYDDTALKEEMTGKIDKVNESLLSKADVSSVLVNGKPADHISFIYEGGDDFSVNIPGATDENDNFIPWTQLLKENGISSYDPKSFDERLCKRKYKTIRLSDDITGVWGITLPSGVHLSLPYYLTKVGFNFNNSDGSGNIYIDEIPQYLTSVDALSNFVSENVPVIHVNKNNKELKEITKGEGTFVVDKSGSFLYLTSNTATELPEGYKYVSSGIFYKSKISAITIPSSICVLSGFRSCPNLKTVSFETPISHASLSVVFRDCPSLTEIALPEGYLSIDASLKNGNLTKVSLPESLKKILDGSFSNQTALTSITIPQGVEIIDSNCFSDCPNLTTIYYKGSASGAPWGATNAKIVTDF